MADSKKTKFFKIANSQKFFAKILQECKQNSDQKNKGTTLSQKS